MYEIEKLTHRHFDGDGTAGAIQMPYNKTKTPTRSVIRAFYQSLFLLASGDSSVGELLAK